MLQQHSYIFVWHLLILLLPEIYALNFDEQVNTTLYDDFQTARGRAIMRIAKAADMRVYMKPNFDPCTNFYAHACGNWHHINPVRTSIKNGIFHTLTQAYNRKAETLLRSKKRTNESHMERRVKYFYESCLNRTRIRHNNREQLISIMEEFGGMPALKSTQFRDAEFDWLDVIARILRKYGTQIIIGIDTRVDLVNNQVNRLYIGQIDYLTTNRSTSYYTLLERMVYMLLQEELDMRPELAKKTAREISNFEQSLAAGIADPLAGLGVDEKNHLRLLDEMSENYKPVNLTRFVKIWLGYEYRLPVYEYVENYLKNLRKLILETPTEVVANYIMWQLIQDFRIEFESTQKKHSLKCVEITKTHFVKYLDNMMYRYQSEYYPTTFQYFHQMWLELKNVFERTFRSMTSNWLTQSVREKAIEKLNSMTMEINSYESDDFEKEFGQLTIDTQNYFENLRKILELRGKNFRLRINETPKLRDNEIRNFSPAYAPEFNKVLIPVAFLQPRFLWDDVYPAALKYSTVGFIIAHEMAHAFDDTLRIYDAKGNLNNWWDRNSTDAYIKRKECLIQQYSEYTSGGYKLEKSNEQSENIADNIGIRVAYAAYEIWLNKNSNNKNLLQNEYLPNLNYTPRQLFFLGSAQVWCTDVNSSLRDILIETDTHAPEDVRVIGMLSNLDEFAMEFKCVRGSKMNPLRKCIIF